MGILERIPIVRDIIASSEAKKKEIIAEQQEKYWQSPAGQLRQSHERIAGWMSNPKRPYQTPNDGS